jgi:pimeloyl-ACP methyl ester carboxylesterase
MFSSLTTQEMQKHILSMMLGAPASAAAGAMKAVMDPAIWKEDVTAKPVLGIYAGNSTLLIDIDYMKTCFPNLEYVKMSGSGHFLMIEKPQGVHQRLKSFLDKQKY